MSKQIIADTFETLGGVAKSAGQQVVADAKKAGEDVAIELGVKTAQQQTQGDQTSSSTQTEEQTQKINEAAKKRTAARYREIQVEIKDLEDKRRNESIQRVAEKPGIDEDKKVKQLEMEEEKEKLPPLPVQRASKKAETFRGASG